ncbi:lipopolysaccharide biosynthesis protein [Aquabacterium sp.]|uniref:lipopolysaccharide biosynthesis protein n=1 Tax=Aquabacterium sp. TaxID=1872578 RepID=UPI003BB0F5B4
MVSSIAGFGAMVLVVRCLPVVDFAHYSVLIALVEYLTAFSALGLAHVVIRYVPELYMKGYSHSLRVLLRGATSIRAVVLLGIALIGYWLSAFIVPWIGMSGAAKAFEAFLVVAVIRSTGHFFSQILESTLHQGVVQIAFSLASVGRLVGMLYLYHRGDVQLVEIIWVEAMTDAIATTIMAGAVFFVATRNKAVNEVEGDLGWLSANFKTVSKFAYHGYIQHLAGLPFGSNTNRLIGGYFLTASAMANFGFALSLYEYLKRYLPAQLLVGLIRPVLIAKYSVKKDFSVASSMCENIFIINIALIGGGVVCMLVAGPNLMHVISGGKYVDDATFVFMALLSVLLLETNRLQLELLVQTVERYEILILSNAMLAASVGLGILLVGWLGAAAFPIGNALGLLVANQRVNRRLRRLGYIYQHDWRVIMRLVALIVFSVIFGKVMLGIGLAWYVALAVSIFLYCAAAYLLYGVRIRSFIGGLSVG